MYDFMYTSCKSISKTYKYNRYKHTTVIALIDKCHNQKWGTIRWTSNTAGLGRHADV